LEGRRRARTVRNQCGAGRRRAGYLLCTRQIRQIAGLAAQARSTRNAYAGCCRICRRAQRRVGDQERGTLWRIVSLSKARTKIAENVTQAAVGDGANYYVTKSGGLFVRGKAHRGKYGDGRLTSRAEFTQTASDISYITAQTGHATLLTKSGDVLGTRGNIYGPVGRHGLGDKADRWSRIMSGATATATGSLHTVAIQKDGILAAWGDGYGPEPVAVMSQVIAAAAGSSTTIAIRQDGTLWQWDRGAEPHHVRLK
jgi:alpha-tubulin suppressor-like RCC1 family protein